MPISNPAVYTPASTVEAEKTRGLSEAVGTGVLYARNDHKHGTPASPLTISENEVFASGGSTPESWTDLDLSSVVGSQEVVVCLQIQRAGGLIKGAVRPNGSSYEYYDATYQISIAQFSCNGGDMAVVITHTDASGIIEWITDSARTDVTVDVLWWIE